MKTEDAAQAGSGPSKRIAHPKGRQVDELALGEIRSLLENYPLERHYLIENLHAIQDGLGHLSDRHLTALAREMNLPQAEVFEVASFYHHFDIVKDDATQPAQPVLRICNGIACEMAGAAELKEKLETGLSGSVRVVHAPCVGACHQAPVAVLGRRRIERASPESVVAQVENGGTDPVIPDFIGFDNYAGSGGYEVLRACLGGARDREDVIGEIEAAELLGMGGAGFPTARKWRFLEGTSRPRVLVINADEGEPGTFKDRYCLATDPHKVLEGILIAAWAIHAEDVYVYLRDEYPEIRELLQGEIAAIQKAGLSDGLEIHLRRGAGAYVCGEESALLESIEGKRGLPRNRPPYPARKGLFGRPTIINNVETMYWVSEIATHGADWYADQGRPRFYCVSGRVAEPGVVLAQSDVTARQLIEAHCGGMAEGHVFKGYLPGGASGGILPASLADLPLSFGELEAYGCFVGSAGVVVLSEADEIGSVVANLIDFFADESCGQCTPCRAGTVKMRTLIDRSDWDVELIRELSEVMRDASICGLGQAAPNSVASALRFFGEEVK